MIYLPKDQTGLQVDEYIGTNMQISVDFQESKMLTREDVFQEKLIHKQDANRAPFPTKPAAKGGN